MANPNPMFQTRPFSLEQMRRATGTVDPARLASYIKNMPATYGYVEDECCFALDTGKWTVPVTAGGAPTAFAYSAQRGGVFAGATGTTDDGVCAIHCANTFLDPADKPFMIIRWLSDVVTGFSFEIGFSDPKTAEELPGVTDVDTPAIGNGVTDIGCIHMDTDQTLTTCALVGDGTTGSVTKTDIGTFTPTLLVYQTMVIGIEPNKVHAVLYNGPQQIGSYHATNGPDSGVLVRPYAMFRTRNTTTKNIFIDYIGYGWERNN